ncbi:hypothetical protein [Prosthecobacter sp.]|uniref:hypothetical protein n=1 Tax=Prosthecobacter sp. TaxID=1965333 RepID=UPI00378383E9
MRPGIRICTGGMCMVAGMLLQFLPGIEGWQGWQMLAAVLLLSGGVFFYLGCRRAARLAEKGSYTSGRRSMHASRTVRFD